LIITPTLFVLTLDNGRQVDVLRAERMYDVYEVSYRDSNGTGTMWVDAEKLEAAALDAQEARYGGQ
jgi:hypothetical protein